MGKQHPDLVHYLGPGQVDERDLFEQPCRHGDGVDTWVCADFVRDRHNDVILAAAGQAEVVL